MLLAYIVFGGDFVAKTENTSKPIPDQIIEETITKIQGDPSFNKEVIEALKILWTKGELNQVERIIEVIKPKTGDLQ